jgi:hypothetical protein
MYYKWIGQFTHGEEICVVTLKMKVPSKRHAKEKIAEKVNQMLRDGFTLKEEDFFRTNKSYVPVREHTEDTT